MKEALGDQFVNSAILNMAVDWATINLLVRKGIFTDDEFEEERLKQVAHFDQLVSEHINKYNERGGD